MARIIEFANGIIWGVPALIMILSVGLLLSIRTGFAQLRLLPKAVSLLVRRLRQEEKTGGVTPFQALCTALAATAGTGNLVGVAGAIALGGPGAIFWMWVCGILGMITKYAEAALAVRFRIRDSGEYVGGPMYLIRRGMGEKWSWLASLYAFFGVIAAFGVGNATQINAVITGFNRMIVSFGGAESRVRNLAMGIVLALIVGAMLLGGAKRIGQAAELLVPFATLGYLALCIGVLVLCADEIPGAFSAIVRGAFSARAITGGAVGSSFQAMRVGISRGVFTNEAGMGTASIAHASAETDHPAEQGMMGILEVFLDTIVICTMTALVILCSGVPIPYGTDAGGTLTAAAFTAVCGNWVSAYLALALCCFALATVLGWGLYGSCCARYLFGPKSTKTFALLQTLTVVLATVLQTGVIWSLAEMVNGLMAIPNLIALVFLSKQLKELTHEYESDCGSNSAAGGTYENLNQRKPLSALSHAKVPSLRTGGQKTG